MSHNSRSTSSPSSPFHHEWPAGGSSMRSARDFLKECAAARLPTLLLPDKDADGLCSGMILYHTIVELGLPADLVTVHFVAKGSNVHNDAERTAISKYGARYIVIADQGSRPGPPIVDDPNVKTLIVDHHMSTEFPEGAQVLSAAQHPPIAASSTLAYMLCLPLVEAQTLETQLDYLCVIGTMGDLGTTFRWEPPFPDMRGCLKKWTKKVLSEAVSLLNAPRRTARYDVLSAWNALLHASNPRELVSTSAAHSRRLHEARLEIRREVEREGHIAPTFSGDGRVALIRISSAAQVHPLIATRWASTLKSSRLEMVMCANDGYLEGQNMTNFACRAARCARNHGDGAAERDGEREVNIIEMLRNYADQVAGLRRAMGDEFARGHQQASGGIVRTEHFERLWEAMVTAEADPSDTGPASKKRKIGKIGGGPAQRNTLDGWLKTT